MFSFDDVLLKVSGPKEKAASASAESITTKNTPFNRQTAFIQNRRPTAIGKLNVGF